MVTVGDHVVVNNTCTNKEVIGRKGVVKKRLERLGCRHEYFTVVLDGEDQAKTFAESSIDPVHVSGFTPEQKELYDAAIALSEAQTRFNKAYEALRK